MGSVVRLHGLGKRYAHTHTHTHAHTHIYIYIYMVPCRRVDSPPPSNGMVPPPTLNPKP